MAKKLVSVWLSLTILLFSSISIYAEENVQGDFFIKDININGEEIDNNHLQYPFFLFENTTYVPITTEIGKILGIEAKMDFESRTLKLLRSEPELKNITDRFKKNERENVITQIFHETRVLVYEQVNEDNQDQSGQNVDNAIEVYNEAETVQNTNDLIYDEVIEMPELSVKEIDLEGFPVLTKGNVVYLPLRVMAEVFKWDIYFDSYTGVYVSTTEGIPAQSFWSEAESKYHQGLVSYIQRFNKSYTVSKAQELLFMFIRAGETYNVDEKILIAVAHKESTFNQSAKGGSGSLGLMQIMPSTGKVYGLTITDLFNAQKNVDFGAKYISMKIADYNGDLVKAFSAYNQGNLPVNRGTHSTVYANRILSTMNGINSYLTSNGYGVID